MYKLTHPDGFDFYSHTINYRDAIGSIVRVTDFDPPSRGSCGKGLHASKKPNDCFIGSKIPCAAFKVKGIQPIARDSQKTRYKALRVLKEIYDLDELFGWKYSEVINPIYPFKIKSPKISESHIKLLNNWASVWASMRDSVWDSVRDSVWDIVWDIVWAYFGSFFPNIKKWKYAPKTNGYTYQACIDLWRQGLVPSYDGKIWRLHGGKNAKVLWKSE